MILSPSSLLNEPEQIEACDMVMVAYFASPHPGGGTLRVVRVGLSSVLETISFLVVDPTQDKPRDATL
jgi:hypothetical protein